VRVSLASLLPQLVLSPMCLVLFRLRQGKRWWGGGQ